MHVPEFIRQIPSFRNTWEPVISFGRTSKDLIVGIWKASLNYLSQTDLWQKQGKSIYGRRIQPLKKTDYMYMTGSLIISSIATALAVYLFGIAVFPLSIGGSTLVVMGVCSLSFNSVQTHFNEIAWGHVDNIRRTANDITYKNQKFAPLNHLRGLLEQPEFDHLKENLKTLDEEIRKFRSVALAPYYEDKFQIVTGHLTKLKGLVNANAQDKVLIEALEAEINKVGKADQDLEKLEMQKQSLLQLQIPPARLHLIELSQQINDLVKVAQSPDFTDSKNAFMKYLEAFMTKLAAHKKIEDLTPSAPIVGKDKPDEKIEEDKDKVQNPKDLALHEMLEKEEEIDDKVKVKVTEVTDKSNVAIQSEEEAPQFLLKSQAVAEN